MCQPPYPGRIRLDPDEKVPFVFVVRELSERGMDEAGLLLWQVLRDVRAWVQAISAPDEPTLREEGWKLEGIVPALAATLPPLDRLLRRPDPDEDTARAVAMACLHLGLWAEDSAAGRTALALFQAAEDADPDNAHYPYHVGRMARKLAMYDEAEAWLKWAGWVARGSGEWEVAALCTSGLGNLHRQRGNLPLAKRYHTLVWKTARRHNLRTLEGDALYDLVGLSFDFGDARQGMEYARRAVEAYGPGHGRIITLARDIAWLWMDCFGEFESAAHVFTALLDHMWEPSDRLLLCANLSRAAAGAGWTEVFEGMWIETWAMMRQQPLRHRHAAALTQLALAAGNLGWWERAGIAAAEALQVARLRREGELILLAESIQAAVQAGVIAEDAIRNVFRDSRHPRSKERDVSVADLASIFTSAMRVRRDGAPEGPTRTLIYNCGSVPGSSEASTTSGG
ncbi:MAG TPA: hypothetical protein VF263_12510 [Longimicrobiaceae bacterium]